MSDLENHIKALHEIREKKREIGAIESEVRQKIIELAGPTKHTSLGNYKLDLSTKIRFKIVDPGLVPSTLKTSLPDLEKIERYFQETGQVPLGTEINESSYVKVSLADINKNFDLSAYLTKMYREDIGTSARVGSSITFANGAAAIVVGFENNDHTLTDRDGAAQNHNSPVWELGSRTHIVNTAQKLVNEGEIRARDGEPTESSELLDMLNLNKQNQQAPLSGITSTQSSLKNTRHQAPDSSYQRKVFTLYDALQGFFICLDAGTAKACGECLYCGDSGSYSEYVEPVDAVKLCRSEREEETTLCADCAARRAEELDASLDVILQIKNTPPMREEWAVNDYYERLQAKEWAKADEERRERDAELADQEEYERRKANGEILWEPDPRD